MIYRRRCIIPVNPLIFKDNFSSFFGALSIAFEYSTGKEKKKETERKRGGGRKPSGRNGKRKEKKARRREGKGNVEERQNGR
ncbi:hypothetical protein A7N06_21470 [Acinetobacter baumannii]|nr:hypothetical protein A7N06_21470 [Acinetobacter baumannii]